MLCFGYKYLQYVRHNYVKDMDEELKRNMKQTCRELGMKEISSKKPDISFLWDCRSQPIYAHEPPQAASVIQSPGTDI